MRRAPRDPMLPAALLEAHPLATLLVDRSFRIVLANDAARRSLGAEAGATLGEALGCAEGGGGCGGAPICAGCGFRRAVERALAGETSRARGFVFRAGGRGARADLHLLAVAAPFERRRRRGALLALDDAGEILSDPAVVEVCSGCGRVADGEGGWHRLDRFLDDRLGIEPRGPCGDCASRLGSGPRPP